jgi:hypothetical protein
MERWANFVMQGVICLTLMEPMEIPDDAAPLKSFSTARLERLLPELLRELRQRDSKHMKGDAITNSRTLRALRKTGKLP